MIIGKRDLYFYQDGGEFHVTLNRNCDPFEFDLIISPIKVADMDCGAAEAAFTWFVGECDRHNLTPVRTEGR